MGFDQMMLFYNHYTVTSSKITITIVNTTAAAQYAAACLYLSPDTTSITNAGRLMENGLLRWRVLQPTGSNSSSVATLSLNCDVAMYFGRDKKRREIVEDVNLSGTAAANPVEQVYFVIGAFDPFGATAMTTFFTVNLEFTAIFWEPKEVTQS